MSPKIHSKNLSPYLVGLIIFSNGLSQANNAVAGSGSCPASGSNSITNAQISACALANNDSLTVTASGSITYNGGNAVTAEDVSGIGTITNNGTKK